jgi:hypothetical protein
LLPRVESIGNCNSSRIFLSSNEYLVFGSRTDSTWKNNILKDALEMVDPLVKCVEGAD